MSRIGKQPITLPEKVQVNLEGSVVKVKGPKGELSYTTLEGIKVEQKEKELHILPGGSAKTQKAYWGLTRTLVANMVTGVSEGFTKSLIFNGVGYKAAVSGNKLTLNLGYSHPIDYVLPEGIQAQVQQSTITISGISKELVGLVAAKVRSFRPPEPYKGKGIKYSDETIIRKAGKTGAKKG